MQAAARTPPSNDDLDVSTVAMESMRKVGLRPTVARLTVLQVITSASPKSISADGIYRELIRIGANINIGTIYRTIQDLCQAALVLREPDTNFPILYRLRAQELDDNQQVRLISRATGRIVLLHDDELHGRLLSAAKRMGVDLAGQFLSIKYDDETEGGTRKLNRGAMRRPRLVK